MSAGAVLVVVSLSAEQLNEAAHKASILKDEPDLLASYDWTAAQGEALWDLLRVAKPGRVSMTEDQALTLEGELENSQDIAEANVEAGDDDWKSAVRSIRDARHKLMRAVADLRRK